MNPENLAPIYLDNQPITLKDPKPKLSAVLSASGKTDVTDVKWLQFQPNTPGKTVRAEEVLDRTSEPNKPIYLTSKQGQGAAHGAMEAGKGKESAGQHGMEGKAERFAGGKPVPVEEGAGQIETAELDVRRQGERQQGDKPHGEKQGAREFGAKSTDE